MAVLTANHGPVIDPATATVVGRITLDKAVLVGSGTRNAFRSVTLLLPSGAPARYHRLREEL